MERYSVKILVGALQDVTVVEGTPATFTLPALPEGVTVSNWYRVKNGKATALNVTDTSYTVKVPTNADDDGTAVGSVAKSVPCASRCR
ncbi:hypothetical protein WP50_03015, partial [Lactiplantibacillus plantarum]